MIKTKSIELIPMSRGCHLITQNIISKIGPLPEQGLLNLFIQHTSAGITINENADPTVRVDLNNSLDQLVKEDEPFYTHTTEGPDDMPAHIKSTLIGSSVTIPIVSSQLALGTWQGIYVFEHRKSSKKRTIKLHLIG